MKKQFILSLFVLFSFITIALVGHNKIVDARMNLMISGGQTPSCVPQAKITFWWECESTTVEYSAGDTTATGAGETEAINTDAVKSGTNGLDAPAAGDWYRFDQTDTSIFGSEARIGFWFYVTSGFGTNAPRFLMAEVAVDKPEIWMAFDNSSNRFVRFSWNNDSETDVTASGDVTINTGAWYWIELYYDHSDDSLGWIIYNSSLVEVDSATASGTFEAIGTPDDFMVGSTQTSGDVFMDHIIVINDHDQSLLSCANESSYPY